MIVLQDKVPATSILAKENVLVAEREMSEGILFEFFSFWVKLWIWVVNCSGIYKDMAEREKSTNP